MSLLHAQAKPFVPSSQSMKDDQDRPEVESDPIVNSSMTSPSPRNVGNKNKSKTSVTPTDIFQFHYDHPTTLLSSSSCLRRSARKPKSVGRDKSMSTAEFVQANFRFVMSPLSRPDEPAWFDPNAIVPWESVECIVAKIGQDNNMICPICLDLVNLPRITKCGHTYCWICLLQHMNCDRSNRLKCPMCMDFIFPKDLKPVRFEDSMTASHSATRSHKPALVLNERFALQHLELERGRITPSLYNPSMHRKNLQSASSLSGSAATKPLLSQHFKRLSECLPEEYSAVSRFCRIMIRSVANVRSAWALDLQLLVQMKSELKSEAIRSPDCYAASQSAIDDAVQFIAESQSAFDLALSRFTIDCEDIAMDTDFERENMQLLAELSHSSNVNSVSTGAGDRNRNAKGRSTAHAHSSSKGNRERQISKKNSSTTATGSVTCDADDEQLQLALALSASMIAPADGALPQRPVSALDLSSANLSHIFQSTAGWPVFLHPLCTQCLLQQAALDGEAGRQDSACLLTRIDAKIIDIERVQLTAVQGKTKFNFLKHLPFFTEVYIVEVDLKTLVSKQVLTLFQEELSQRTQKRKDKKRIEEREKRMANADKIREEVQRQERLAHYNELRESKLRSIAEMSSGPTAGEAYRSSAEEDTVSVPEDTNNSKVESFASKLQQPSISYREVTQMSGYFPSLESAMSSSESSGNKKAEAASRPMGVWGPKVTASSTPVSDSTPQESKSKDKKKGKVSLLSNASARSYR